MSEKRAPQCLEDGAATFRERNAIYGDTYLEFGRAFVAVFPNGLTIKPGDVAAANRLGVLVQCLSKVCRYGSNFDRGGHLDSAHDLMVYAAILEELTER